MVQKGKSYVEKNGKLMPLTKEIKRLLAVKVVGAIGAKEVSDTKEKAS